MDLNIIYVRSYQTARALDLDRSSDSAGSAWWCSCFILYSKVASVSVIIRMKLSSSRSIKGILTLCAVLCSFTG